MNQVHTAVGVMFASALKIDTAAVRRPWEVRGGRKDTNNGLTGKPGIAERGAGQRKEKEQDARQRSTGVRHSRSIGSVGEIEKLESRKWCYQ